MIAFADNKPFIGSIARYAMECVSCEKRESEVDALIGGEYKRMCKMCAQLEGAVVVERPNRNNVMDSYKRATVKEVLTRMSGIQKNKPAPVALTPKTYNPISTQRVKLSQRNEEEQYSNQTSGNGVVSRYPARTNAASAPQMQAPTNVMPLEEEPKAQEAPKKKGFFSRLFGGRSNVPEVPSPQGGPSLPPMGTLNTKKPSVGFDDGVLEL